MQDIKAHDYIQFNDVKEEILARIEDLVFTQVVLETGARKPVEGPFEIKDLIVWGFKKVEE